MENKLTDVAQNNLMINFVKTDDILKDMCGIIESSQKAAYQAVNTTLVQRNWMIGYRIAEEEFGGEERSEYGLKVIKKLSKELTNLYGKGYDRGTLYRCLRFYRMFPEIVASLRQQSGTILSWTHYRILLPASSRDEGPPRTARGRARMRRAPSRRRQDVPDGWGRRCRRTRRG